jgi:hypothetical protein
MVAVTYGVARVPAAEPAARTGRAEPAVARKNWFARLLDALVESRMRQAQSEIRRHIHLLPYSFDERGNRLVKSNSGELPFGGW